MLAAREADFLLLLWLSSVLSIFILTLEKVAMLVFILDVAFSLIFSEETTHFAPIKSENPATAYSAVILPLSLVKISIQVVVNTCAITHIVFHISFVEFSIRHEDLDLAISNLVAVEASLNDLIGQTEKNTIAKWLVVTPFSFVDCTCLAKLADTST